MGPRNARGPILFSDTPLRVDVETCTRTLSLQALATMIAEFLTELDLRRVTVVCNDWGGAQLVISPGGTDRVANLVLVSCEAFDNYPPGVPGRLLCLNASLPTAPSDGPTAASALDPPSPPDVRRPIDAAGSRELRTATMPARCPWGARRGRLPPLPQRRGRDHGGSREGLGLWSSQRRVVRWPSRGPLPPHRR